MYWYRQDIFDKYGIEVPTTWDEFREASIALHEADPAMYLANFPNLDSTYAGLLAQAGQVPFGVDGTNLTVDWNSSETEPVTEYWQGMLDDDLTARTADFSAEWNQGVAAGQFASFFGGAWYPLLLKPAAPDQSGLWRVATLPQWNEGDNEGADAGLAGYAVTKQSENPQAAADFIEWLTSSEESVTMLHDLQSQFPSFKPVLDSDALLSQEDPYFGNQKVNEIFRDAASGISDQYVYGPVYDYTLTNLVQGVAQSMAEETTLAEMMDTLQEETVTHATDQGFTVN